MRTYLALPVLALFLASCTVVHRQAPETSPQQQQQPVNNKPAPSPWPPEAPPVPNGVPWYHDKLELKYDAALEDCYNASKKGMVFMKFTEADLEKKTGELCGVAGPLFIKVTMYRKRHHTYLTCYARVHGHRVDARAPDDMAKRFHEFVGKQVKEEGRKTD
jgi:hypothetical protein